MADATPLNIFRTKVVELTTAEQTIYTAPTGYSGIILGAQVTNIANEIDNVSNAERTSDVATITTSAAHTLQIGNIVVVNIAEDATYNGTVTILSVPSTTTFTYSNDGDDATASVTGTVKNSNRASITFVLRKNSIDYTMLKEYQIPPNDAAEATTGKLVLEQGSSVKAKASVNSSLNLILSLLETTNEQCKTYKWKGQKIYRVGS